MENTTDLSTIQDTTLLKSMAYDQVGVIEQAQQNLRLIQQRLAQVQQQELQAIGQKDATLEPEDETQP